MGWPSLDGGTAVTIGVFDGVHLGHRAILERLRALAEQHVVLTFDPHPAEVLHSGTHPRLLTTLEERLALLDGLGVDTVGVLDLSEIRNLEPGEFVEGILLARLGAVALVVGSDFHFGRDRTGDVAFLRRMGEATGFSLEVVELVGEDGVISSSRIRDLVEAGDVSTAARLMGSWYAVSNEVTSGDRRGAALGFPTANLAPPSRKVLPAHGVYAGLATVEGERHPAAVNVGVRPTFGDGAVAIEAHLLDFDGDLYGRLLVLEFVERLRPELRFETVEELVATMRADVEQVRRILAPVLAS